MRKLLRTIFLVDLMKGMWLTLKYTPQPAFTFQYPAERRPTAPRFRGVLRLQTEPATGAQTCIVCDQCEGVPRRSDCPWRPPRAGPEDQDSRLLRLQPLPL